MTPAEFVKRCPALWHVAAFGAWDLIQQCGFLTAQQIIDHATIDDATRHRLSTSPRRERVSVRVGGARLIVRDQGPLFARKDLEPILEEGMTTADWIRLLNDRVYFFANRQPMQTLCDKYARLDGAVEVLTIDTRRLLDAAGPALELAAQNTGAVARRRDRYKTWDTFKPLADFRSERPHEVTVRGGLRSIDPVSTVQRVHANGSIETLG